MVNIQRFLSATRHRVANLPPHVKSASLEWLTLAIVAGCFSTVMFKVPEKVRTYSAVGGLGLIGATRVLGKKHVDAVRLERTQRQFQFEEGVEKLRAKHLPHQALDFITSHTSQTQVIIARALNFDGMMKVQAAGGGGASYTYRRYYFNLLSREYHSDPVRALGQIKSELALNHDQEVFFHESVPGHQGMAVDIGLTEAERTYPKLTKFLGNVGNTRLIVPMGIDNDRLVTLDVEEDQVTTILVAGMSGSGKSEWMKSTAAFMACLYDASEVGLAFIDLKTANAPATFKDEDMWNDLPHAIAPVVCDPKDGLIILYRLLDEIHQRIEDFSNGGCSDIFEFNRRYKSQKRSHLFAFIDEAQAYNLNTIEGQIYSWLTTEISRLGRSAGVHLIPGYQRSSKDEIPVAFRSQVSHAVCLKVKDPANAALVVGRTIEDPVTMQAPKLAGKGDLILVGKGADTRCQGLYCDRPLPDLPVKASMDYADPEFYNGTYWELPTYEDVKAFYGEKFGKGAQKALGGSRTSEKPEKVAEEAKAEELDLELLFIQYMDYGVGKKGHSFTGFCKNQGVKAGKGSQEFRKQIDKAIFEYGEEWIKETLEAKPETSTIETLKLFWGEQYTKCAEANLYEKWVKTVFKKYQGVKANG